MRLAVLALAFGVGAGVALAVRLPWESLLLWGLAGAALLGALHRARLPLLPGLAALALVAGAARGSPAHPTPAPPPPAGTATLVGRVAGPVEVEGLRIRFTLRPEDPTLPAVQVSARLPPLLAQRRPPLLPGDRVRATGRLRPASPFWVREGVPWAMQADRLEPLPMEGRPLWAFPSLVRQRGAEVLNRSLPPVPAALAQALLLGLRGDLPPSVLEAFRASGTAHLLAVSGLHIGMALAGGLALARWVAGGYRWGLLLPLLAVWGYALLAGLRAPVVRASLMASAFLLARLLGRERTALPALALAGLAMVSFRPSYVFSPSFQMSLSAVAGILLLTEPLGRSLRLLPEEGSGGGPWSRLRRWLGEALAVSLSAGLAVAPLIALHFREASPWGLLATPLALPALPPALGLSAFTALAGWAWEPLGRAVGTLAWPFLAWPLAVAAAFARLPGAGVETAPLIPSLALGAALLLAWGRPLLGALRRLRGASPLRLLPFAGALAVAVWVPALLAPDGLLHLQPLDGGRAVLIRGPHGTRLLVVGDARTGPLLQDLDRALPFWTRRLDGLLLTGRGEDAGAEVLRRYRVGLLMAPPGTGPALQALARGEGVPALPLAPGALLRLAGGPVLGVEEGPVLRLRYGHLDLRLPSGRPMGEGSPWPRGLTSDGRRAWVPP